MDGFKETKEIRIELISGKMAYSDIEKAICKAYCLGICSLQKTNHVKDVMK